MAARRPRRSPRQPRARARAEVVVALSTAPSEEVAVTLARALVDEHLIACANLLPRARSIYRWQGAVQDEVEVVLVMKTTASTVPALKRRLDALHPYETPEMLVIPVASGLGPYLDWVVAETTGPARPRRV
ncbi:MAG: divalent-cation tolerance protein CutA [Myxococcaceae bacterium]|jgi:periplasmic divalent cation tolerance protein|nr:divalent-cation tolerance protein CutA [Myxococcaceae bacterium]MCA3011012.1 divalent-cation tolerance protein CutA [Myxococcaceae bacterium]